MAFSRNRILCKSIPGTSSVRDRVLTLCCLLALQILIVDGYRLKYANINWKQEDEFPLPVIRFTLTTAWVWSSFVDQESGCETCSTLGGLTCTPCTGTSGANMVPAVGDTISFYDEWSNDGSQVNKGVPIRFDFGDASQALSGDRAQTGIPPTPKCKLIGQLEYGMCMQGYVQEVDAGKDEMIVVSEIVHSFPNPGTFQASFQGCCRPDLAERNVQNNAGQPWKLLATVVALDLLPNQSPIPVVPPTVYAVLGRELSFRIPAYNHAPDTHTLTWSIGTISEHDPLLGPTSGPPAGISIDASTGEVTFTAKFAVGVYSVVVLVQSIAAVQIARVSVDLYIEVVDGGGNTPPLLLAPSSAQVHPVRCDAPFSLAVAVSDEESPLEDVAANYASPHAVLFNVASKLWESRPRPALVATAQAGVAMALEWTAPCEVLGAHALYGFRGEHELGAVGVCFTASDDGRTPQGFATPLTSPPACAFLRVLRCTQPLLDLRRAGGYAAERAVAAGNGTQRVYTAPVGSIVTWDFNATDDSQTLGLVVAADLALGLVPGFAWADAGCQSKPAPGAWSPASIPTTACNPVVRKLTFSADVTHAGKSKDVCILASNDQTQCTASLSFSAPICFNVETPGPRLRYKAPTPAEGELLLTYLGCPLHVDLLAVDDGEYFDLTISADEGTSGLPTGAYLEDPQCGSSTLPVPPGDTSGILQCVQVQRRMVWRPVQAQQGMKARVCFSVQTLTELQLDRCINLEVSKCRYCLQPGETLQSVAVSFSTDWLQILAANAHLSSLDTLAEFQLINLGALYPARAGDTLDALQWRFRATKEAILGANPDISSSEQALTEGQLVCILAGTCSVAQPAL